MKTIRRPIETWTQIISCIIIVIILAAFTGALITGKEPIKDNVMKDDDITNVISPDSVSYMQEFNITTSVSPDNFYDVIGGPQWDRHLQRCSLRHAKRISIQTNRIDFIYTQSNDVDNQIVWYGTNASITLSGNTIVILTDLSEGMSGDFIITQDLIGGNEFKMYPKPRICNGIFSDIILISESNSTYSVSWMYNGTDLFVNSYELESDNPTMTEKDYDDMIKSGKKVIQDIIDLNK